MAGEAGVGGVPNAHKPKEVTPCGRGVKASICQKKRRNIEFLLGF